MKIKKLIPILTLAGVLSVGVVGFSTTSKISQARAAYSQGSVIPNNKARIWIGYDTSNPFYSYADAGTGIRLWIHSTSSGGSELVYGTITGEFDNAAQSNRRYDYFDVDLSVYTNQWYMTVQKFQNNNWKAATNPIQLKASNACQVYFVWGDWAWDKTQGTVAAGSVDSVDAGFAAKALGGLHTCSNSAVNGYNAFDNFDSTFVKNGESWKTVGNLSDYELTDFSDGNTSYSGDPDTTTNAYDKYVAIGAMKRSGGTSLSKAFDNQILNQYKTSAIATVVIISVISVTAIGGYFFLRRRKEN